MPRPPALLLVCFPYAGGASFAFRDWPHALPDAVEVAAVELPGRGFRFPEPLIAEPTELIAHVAAALTPALERPHVLFGHSMGALLAFEVARALRRCGARAPAHLVVSACAAPDALPDERDAHTLPDPALLERLRRLGGTPESVLRSEELARVFLPIVRADLAIIERYGYTTEPPLSCPVTAFAGTADRAARPDEVAQWRRHTTGPFATRLFHGGHFFVHTARDAVLRALAEIVAGEATRST